MPDTKPEEIMALSEDKLLAILKNPDAPLFDKAQACERLAVVGGKDAVAVLLAHYGRFGLQPNPDPSADEAFRSAMAKLKGPLLVGVINSIGQRRDAASAGALTKLLHDHDPEVASAAAAALGRIGGPAAAKALQQALGHAKGPALAALGDSCLVCAEGLLAQGNRKEAMALYAALRRPELPKSIRTAAGLAK
jgi:hypothetical protein